MPSLKCMFFDKWLHKGQISQEEYDAAMKKLDGHNRQIREDTLKNMKCDRCVEGEFSFEQGQLEGWLIAIDKIEQMLSELPTINGYIDSAYLWQKWEQLKEQMWKGAENE